MSVTRFGVTAPRAALLVIAMSFALVSTAHATGTVGRTFVKSTGLDSNSSTGCGLTAPCRTLAVAYSVTAPGGEIDVLDSAGYGTLTISQSVSIVGAQFGSITVPASATGITIAAGSGTVIINNLQIDGNGAGGNVGIKVNSGSLILQHSTLKLLGNGLQVGTARAFLQDTDIIGNTNGVVTTGTGTAQETATTGTGSEVFLSRGNVINNTTAFFMISPGATSGQNNITIFLQSTDNTSTAIPTNVVGNGTVASGSGSECNSACNSVGLYNTNGGFNYQ